MNFHLYKTKCQNVAFFPCLFHSISSIRGRCFHGVSSKFWSTFQRFTKCFQRRSILSSCFPRDRSNIHQKKHNCHRSQLTNLQNSVPVKTPIKCDLNLTKKELHKLTFDRLANIFTHSDIFFHSVKCFSHHRIFFYIVKYFFSLEEDHSYKKLQLGKLHGPKLTAIVHREMDLPIFWLDSIHLLCLYVNRYINLVT